MITLHEVDAFAAVPSSAGVDVRFGVYLPGITAADGYQVSVLVLHSADRFDPNVPAIAYPLDFAGGANGLWSKTVPIAPKAGTNLGLSGRNLYRYQLCRQLADGTVTVITDWFTDPFARATDDVGQLAACDTPDTVTAFTWHNATWKVPELADLVVYELHVEEFIFTFAGVTERLP